METLYILLVILIVTRALGELAVRAGQPALVGELVGGMLIGVLAHQFSGSLPVLSELNENEVFVALADLGVFFLMLLAGLEMHPKELAQSSKGAFFVALGGLFVPLAGGAALGWFFIPESEYLMPQVLFLAVCMAITAIPVAVKVLIDMNLLRTKTGQLIVSAAVFDDVFGIILLALLIPFIEAGQTPTLGMFGMTLLRIAAFYVIAMVIGLYLLPPLARTFRRLAVEEIEFSMMLVVALGFSVLAELFHLHFIFGAFVAGLFFTGRHMGSRTFERVSGHVTTITTGFLAPIFFAFIGYHLDLAAFGAIPVFVLLLIGTAMISKMIGAGLVAHWLGLKKQDALGVGIGMSGRGAVELIIADIALRAGLFDHPQPAPPLIEHMFSAIVIMAIATTLLMPIGLRLALGDQAGNSKRSASGSGLGATGVAAMSVTAATELQDASETDS